MPGKLIAFTGILSKVKTFKSDQKVVEGARRVCKYKVVNDMKGRCPVLETKLYKPLCDGANNEGWRIFKIIDGGFFQRPGDIVGSDPTGRAVLLEVKILRRALKPEDIIPWEQFSAHQMNWLAAISSVGGLALIALYDPVSDRMSLYQIRGSNDYRRAASEIWIGDLTLNGANEFRGWKKLTLVPRTDS